MLELKRKLFHLFGVLSLLVPVYFCPYWLNLFLFLTAATVNYLIVKRHPLLLKIFGVFIEHLERERNLSKPGIQSFYLLLGVFISYLFFEKQAIYGIITLAVGDAFSGMVGYYLGKRRLPYNPKKTLEGTLAFFISSFIALSLVTEPSKALVISLISAVVESLPLKLDDNFTIPLISSLIAYLL
ncbi:diacylglycerol/polyprenol kinase family protein [Aquifex sp.]